MRIPILLLLTIGIFSQMKAQNPQKWALIVAVSEYPASSGWKTLHTEKDVEMVKASLINQGFAEKNIFILQGELATYSNIRLNFEQLLLKKANPGDVVFFHFSGHGQQIMDLGGDELDGKDESLVPYDAGSKYIPGIYEGQNHLTDDTLAVVFKALRQKIGPTGQLIAVVDACHSGTGLRSPTEASVRGTVEVFGSDNWKTSTVARNVFNGSDQQLDLTETEDLGSVVAFFGSKANEVNMECRLPSGEKMGSLSYAFSTHFAKSGSTTSYKGLFEKIRREMARIAPTQSPTAEGNLDYLVLNGIGKTTGSFFRVEVTQPDFWVINGGQLHGLTEGSMLGFFEAETDNLLEANCLLKTPVLESDYLSSRVAAQDNRLKGAFVYLLEQNPGDLIVSVRLVLRNRVLKQQIESILAQDPMIKIHENADCMLTENPKGDSLYLSRADFSVIRALSAHSSQLSWITAALKQHGRAELLRAMEGHPTISSTGFPDFKIDILPVEVVNGKVVYLPIERFLDPAGTIQLPAGTKIRLRISNPGKRSGYFNLLNIQSDDVVNVLFPELTDLKKSAEDYYFAGGIVETFELPKPEGRAFKITKPYGLDLLKLLVSKNPIDLRWMANPRGAGSEEELSELDQDLSALLFPKKENQTRAARLPVEKIYVSDLYYQILSVSTKN